MVTKGYLAWGAVVCLGLTISLAMGWSTQISTGSPGRGSSGFWTWGGGK
jgi:hypothetical protein